MGHKPTQPNILSVIPAISFISPQFFLLWKKQTLIQIMALRIGPII